MRLLLLVTDIWCNFCAVSHCVLGTEMLQCAVGLFVAVFRDFYKISEIILKYQFDTWRVWQK